MVNDVIKCEDIVIIAGYLSPNSTRDETVDYMDELENVLRSNTGVPLLLLGDFNARSVMWGCNIDNDREQRLMDLTNRFDLRLLNVGNVPTCIRAQGTSVVDTSWSSPGLVVRIMDWQVLNMEESFSDHQYIRFDVLRMKRRVRSSDYVAMIGPHWCLNSFKLELFGSVGNYVFRC